MMVGKVQCIRARRWLRYMRNCIRNSSGEVKLDDDDDDDEDDDDDDKDDEEDDDEQNNSSNIQYGTTAALPRTNRNVIRLKRTRTNSNSNSNSIPQQQMPNHNTQNLQSLQQNL